MTFKEIRDHKFKILFMYYTLNEDVDNVIMKYFENYPYEMDDDINEYLGNTSKTLKNINKVSIETNETPKNESDKAIEIAISEEDNIRDIKYKIKDIVEKTSEIDELVKNSLKEWDMTRVGKAELTIIRLAVYEMYFDESMDLKVAINEAVELAKVYADDKADKFVNGVLATIYKSKCEMQ